MTGVPVLAYHPMNISGNAYETNDHVALQEDLQRFARDDVRVVPLEAVVEALLDDRIDQLDRSVAITFDDGSDFDVSDLPHPAYGLQKSMLTILREARGDDHAGRPLQATAFVIVSPAARRELDRKCMIGRGWWNDHWWASAEATGMLRIESHSWDHNHASLDTTVASAPPGAFDLTRDDEAEREIAGANEYLRMRRGRGGPVLFAYPYGAASDFLAHEYFPRGEATHGIRAAFTTDGAPVHHGTDRWRIPRFVCGFHWNSSDTLQQLLEDCWR